MSVKRRKSNRIEQMQAESRAYMHNLWTGKKTVGSGATSIYKGRILKPSQISQIKVRSLGQRSGACSISETHGLVTDADVVGIGHTSWSFATVQKAVSYAIIRKLVMVAGAYPESVGANLQLGNREGEITGAWYMVFDRYDTNGTYTGNTYVIPQNASLRVLAETSGLEGYVQAQWTDVNPLKLHAIRLYCTDDGEHGGRLAAMLQLKQFNMTLMLHATTGIQNRTLGAVTSGNTADTVDAQPLKGPAFGFRGLPKSKDQSKVPIECARREGVILYRRGEEVYTNEGYEVPARGEFSNVTESQYIRLAPGEIKSFSTSKTFRGSFESVMDQLKITSEGSEASQRYSNLPGPSQMIFLEEEMNTGSANNIRIGYETQHTCGVVLSKMKAGSLAAQFSEFAVNNPA